MGVNKPEGSSPLGRIEGGRKETPQTGLGKQRCEPMMGTTSRLYPIIYLHTLIMFTILNLTNLTLIKLSTHAIYCLPVDLDLTWFINLDPHTDI